MRKAFVWFLRLVGVALIVVILTKIQYRDRLLPAGEGTAGAVAGAVVGSVVEEGGRARFQPADARKPPVALPPDWADREDLVRVGLLTSVRRSDRLLLLVCAALFGPLTLISITRWWYLLRRIDIRIGFGEAFQLTFIGGFFNTAFPGSTGGDLVKAVYIARRARGVRIRAAVSVYVDRFIGLFGLGLLATIVLVPRLGDPRLRAAAALAGLVVGVGLVFAVLVPGLRLHRLLGLRKLVRRLPFSGTLLELERAVTVYRRCPGAIGLAVVLSLVNHLVLALLTFGLGRSLGIGLDAGVYLVLVPVCLVIAAVPLLPGGWGAREGAFVLFFGKFGVPFGQAFALSVTLGVAMLLWSLLGGWFFFVRPDRVTTDEVESFSREVSEELSGPVEYDRGA